MEILDALPEGDCGPCEVPGEEERVQKEEEQSRHARMFLGKNPAGPWSLLSCCNLDALRQENVYGCADEGVSAFAEESSLSRGGSSSNAQASSASVSTSPVIMQNLDSMDGSKVRTAVTDANDKRQRNIEAARRYRKRKVDQVYGLEEELAATKMQLESTKLKLARAEAEVDVLRRMLQQSR